jgi:hypothetical protein
MELTMIAIQNLSQHTPVVDKGTHARATSSQITVPEPVLACRNTVFGIDNFSAE